MNSLPWVLVPSSSQLLEDDERFVLEDVLQGRVSETLAGIPQDALVFTRFRSIPFGKELEADIRQHGCEPVNSYRQHRNIADLFTWVGLLEGLTAPAFTIDDMPYLPEGEYFVKGETNSLKNRWFQACYVSEKSELMNVVRNVQNDMYVGDQRVVIRPFRSFRQVGEMIDGRPVFNERRFFVLDGCVVSEGFYWSPWSIDFGEPDVIDRKKLDATLIEVISRVQHLARFMVIDMAEFEDGSWEVVELNDGNMSGLCDNDPFMLWSGVVEVLGDCG